MQILFCKWYSYWIVCSPICQSVHSSVCLSKCILKQKPKSLMGMYSKVQVACQSVHSSVCLSKCILKQKAKSLMGLYSKVQVAKVISQGRSVVPNNCNSCLLNLKLLPLILCKSCTWVGVVGAMAKFLLMFFDKKFNH